MTNLSALQVESIGLKSYNNAEHGNFHVKVMNLLTKVEAATIACTEQLPLYKTTVEQLGGSTKKQLTSAKTEELHEMDKRRDNDMSYIRYAVKMNSYARQPEMVEAARQLTPVLAPYAESNSIGATQKSQQIIGMVDALQDPKVASYVELLQLTIAVSQLKSINQQYIETDVERSVEQEEGKSNMPELRPKADDLYAEIVARINATMMLTPTDTVKELIKELNAVIHSTRTEYNIRMGQIHS